VFWANTVWTPCHFPSIHSTITTILTLLEFCDLETKVTRVHFTKVSVLASRLKISGVGLETKGPRSWSSLWQALGLCLKTKEPRSRSRDQIPNVLVSRPEIKGLALGLEFWKTTWQQLHFSRSSTSLFTPSTTFQKLADRTVQTAIYITSTVSYYTA